MLSSSGQTKHNDDPVRQALLVRIVFCVKIHLQDGFCETAYICIEPVENRWSKKATRASNRHYILKKLTTVRMEAIQCARKRLLVSVDTQVYYDL